MPRAGPLRYLTLTLVGGLLVLASLAGFAWGMYELLQTGSCASGGPYVSSNPCPSDTAFHILAVVAAPFAGMLGMLLLALRGGGSRPSRLLRLFRRRRKRLAERVASGEVPAPVVRAPSAPPTPVPSQTPLNRTWPPATWEPAETPAPQTNGSPIDQLLQLDELRDNGLITAAEFETRRRRLLGGT